MTLRWVFGGQPQMYMLISGDSLLIGRHDECGIVLPHSTVSRRHVSITYEDDLFRLRNLSRTNAVVVYDTERGHKWLLRQDDDVPLRMGYTFHLGSTEFKVISVQELGAVYKIKCVECGQASGSELADCPWCGTSLAFGQSFYVPPDE